MKQFHIFLSDLDPYYFDLFVNYCCDFFFSHITKTTTWEDPRKTLAVQTAAAQHQSTELLTSHQVSPTQSQSPPTTCPGK